jgi:hypothetical protein
MEGLIGANIDAPQCVGVFVEVAPLFLYLKVWPENLSNNRL